MLLGNPGGLSPYNMGFENMDLEESPPGGHVRVTIFNTPVTSFFFYAHNSVRNGRLGFLRFSNRNFSREIVQLSGGRIREIKGVDMPAELIPHEIEYTDYPNTKKTIRATPGNLMFWIRHYSKIGEICVMVKKASDRRILANCECYKVITFYGKGSPRDKEGCCYRNPGLPVGWGFELTLERKTNCIDVPFGLDIKYYDKTLLLLDNCDGVILTSRYAEDTLPSYTRASLKYAFDRRSLTYKLQELK